MLQDHEGYLWFGTKRGLSKYNGYEFVTYKSQPGDSTSLRYHQIATLFEDSNNRLWIGTTGGGLHYYNHEENTFTYVDIYPDWISNSIEENIINITPYSKDEIWIVHTMGLTRINPNSGEIISYKSLFNANELPGQVSTLFKDDSGMLFVAIQDEQILYQYDFNKGKFDGLKWSSDLEIHPEVIHQIYPIDKDNLWLATDKGLLNYDKRSSQVEYIYQANTNIPAINNNINFILQDHNQSLWMGGEDLYLYNKKSQEFNQFKSDPDNPMSVDGNIITCGLNDNQKNLWFGSFSKGLNVNYYKTKQFNSNKALTELVENLSTNITAICKSNELLYLGTWDKGLFIIDSNDKQINIDETFPNLRFLKNKIIRSIKNDKNQKIWIATNEGMLIKFDPENKTIRKYQIGPPDATSAITSILLTNQNKFWIAGNGVFLYDPATDQFIEKKYKNTSIASVQDIVEDNNGNIWIASYINGLFRITNENEIIRFSIEENEAFGLLNKQIVTVFNDSQNRIWIGSEFNGLFLYIPGENRFRQYTVRNGLPSNDICSIQEDFSGRLWIGTNNGLSRFNYQLNDFKNYHWNDGMNADEFNYNSNFSDADGIHYFGCTNGIVIFDPDEIRDNLIIYTVKIEGISVNNGSVITDVNGTSIEKALRTNQPIQLKYNQNTISLKYTTLNYALAKKSNYAYQLQGLDDNFQYVDNQRQITYTNLTPGNYVFKVIASNNDNVWNEDGAEISFTISPPPWFSWWAY
ncbi:MAG: two-component regulator propeller domain-containing protein, partial [Bacteroidota bacterium]